MYFKALFPNRKINILLGPSLHNLRGVSINSSPVFKIKDEGKQLAALARKRRKGGAGPSDLQHNTNILRNQIGQLIQGNN